jgi:hypothetical protein
VYFGKAKGADCQSRVVSVYQRLKSYNFMDVPKNGLMVLFGGAAATDINGI